MQVKPLSCDLLRKIGDRTGSRLAKLRLKPAKLRSTQRDDHNDTSNVPKLQGVLRLHATPTLLGDRDPSRSLMASQRFALYAQCNGFATIRSGFTLYDSITALGAHHSWEKTPSMPLRVPSDIDEPHGYSECALPLHVCPQLTSLHRRAAAPRPLTANGTHVPLALSYSSGTSAVSCSAPSRPAGQTSGETHSCAHAGSSQSTRACQTGCRPS